MSENVVSNSSTSDLLRYSCEDDAKNNTDESVQDFPSIWMLNKTTTFRERNIIFTFFSLL